MPRAAIPVRPAEAQASRAGCSRVAFHRPAAGVQPTEPQLALDAPGLWPNAAELRAWCHLRDDERAFVLARIRSVSPP